jgi:hypothetical protein
MREIQRGFAQPERDQRADDDAREHSQADSSPKDLRSTDAIPVHHDLPRLDSLLIVLDRR